MPAFVSAACHRQFNAAAGRRSYDYSHELQVSCSVVVAAYTLPMKPSNRPQRT